MRSEAAEDSPHQRLLRCCGSSTALFKRRGNELLAFCIFVGSISWCKVREALGESARLADEVRIWADDSLYDVSDPVRSR